MLGEGKSSFTPTQKGEGDGKCLAILKGGGTTSFEVVTVRDTRFKD